METKKVIRVGVSIVVALALLMLGWFVWSIAPSDNARKVWKDTAVTGITHLMAQPMWLSNELGRLTPTSSNTYPDPESWMTSHIIRMRDGEWLVYTNICQKENRRVRDLFIAYGSDDRWYYSTYHFCIGMVVLRMDDQPASLLSFTTNYHLETFDGVSDKALEQTGPQKLGPSN